VAEFVRQEIPVAVEQILGKNDRYIVHGSPGQGNWARVPSNPAQHQGDRENVSPGFPARNRCAREIANPP
jgi:5-methylcytosine-specific restriction protein A